MPFELNDWMSGAGQSQGQWNRQMSGIGAYTGQDWQQNRRRNPWGVNQANMYSSGHAGYGQQPYGGGGNPWLSGAGAGGGGGGFGGGGGGYGGGGGQNPWAAGGGGGAGAVGGGGFGAKNISRGLSPGTGAYRQNQIYGNYEQEGGFGGMMQRINQLPQIESLMKQYNATPEIRANIIRDFLYGQGRGLAGMMNQMLGGGGWGGMMLGAG